MPRCCGSKKKEEEPKRIVYKCDCGDPDCSHQIEFDEEPKATPYCCGVPMKRVK